MVQGINNFTEAEQKVAGMKAVLPSLDTKVAEEIRVESLYRLFNTHGADHLHIINGGEKDSFRNESEWEDEVVACQVFFNQVADAAPLYGPRDQGDPFYTSDKSEANNAPKYLGSTKEGVLGSVYTCQKKKKKHHAAVLFVQQQ
ncbi:hypothetical protein FRB97_001230, partial [Tulasnella sp. 331]